MKYDWIGFDESGKLDDFQVRRKCLSSNSFRYYDKLQCQIVVIWKYKSRNWNLSAEIFKKNHLYMYESRIILFIKKNK